MGHLSLSKDGHFQGNVTFSIMTTINFYFYFWVLLMLLFELTGSRINFVNDPACQILCVGK